MGSLRFRLVVYLSLFAVVLAIGVVGTVVLEKQSVTDAFYFTVVTVSTVGYGDVHPTTDGGKALAIFLIVSGVGTFIGAVANATELMLTRRENQSRFDKLNMVIGVFFSEVGNPLLHRFANASPQDDAIRETLDITGRWTDADFLRASNILGDSKQKVDLTHVDLDELAGFLTAKRDFLVRLLENPVLLEHERFTDLLWAVFHFAEELACRSDRANLPDTDRLHLAGDAQRAYAALIAQWVDYMRHLKKRYPYLFSLAVRTNPFDEDASPVVTT